MELIEAAPSTVGTYQAWVPAPAGISLLQAFQDDDGDLAYAESTAAGAAATHKAEQRVTVDQIIFVHWVSVYAVVRRRAVGTNPSFRIRVRSAGVDIDGPAVVVSQTVYTVLDGTALGWRFEFDPATGKAWTASAALACEFGVVDATGAVAHALRCTQTKRQLMMTRTTRNAVQR